MTTPWTELPPAQVAEICHRDLEEVRSRARIVYLAAERRRTPESFDRLWSRWEQGSRMPGCVRLVLEDWKIADRAAELLDRLAGAAKGKHA